MRAGQVAHRLAQQFEVDARRQIDEATAHILANGGTYEAVQDYLLRCSTEGRVVDPLGQLRDGASLGMRPDMA